MWAGAGAGAGAYLLLPGDCDAAAATRVPGLQLKHRAEQAVGGGRQETCPHRTHLSQTEITLYTGIIYLNKLN